MKKDRNIHMWGEDISQFLLDNGYVTDSDDDPALEEREAVIRYIESNPFNLGTYLCKLLSKDIRERKHLS